MVWIFVHKAQNLLNPSHHCVPPSSTAARRNWSPGEARGGHKVAVGLLLDAGESPHRELLPSPKIGASKPLSRALLRSPPPPKTTLGEFATLCCLRRARPHWERLTVATGLPPRSKGHDAAARCDTPPLSLAEAAVSHSHLDQRPRLDQEDTPSRF
jgi:hypothetical protein